jgi:hypothetical protein
MLRIAAPNEIFRQYFGGVGQAGIGTGFDRFNGCASVKVVELRIRQWFAVILIHKVYFVSLVQAIYGARLCR